jgi:hypothetical protein
LVFSRFVFSLWPLGDKLGPKRKFLRDYHFFYRFFEVSCSMDGPCVW